MNENTPDKLWPVLGEPDWDRISKIAKPSEELKFGGVLRGCWSEGEMVGYATCMIEQVKPLKQFIELNHNERLSALLSKQTAEVAELRKENERLKAAEARPGMIAALEQYQKENGQQAETIKRLTGALEKCRGLLERYHDSGMQDHRQTEMLIEIQSALSGTKETE